MRAPSDSSVSKQERERIRRMPEFTKRKTGTGREAETGAAAGGRFRAAGIPLGLQRRYEASTGLSFSDVNVHYNSPKPERFDALAYTQGSDVFIGKGQEHTLEHELAHVAQQKQGRVGATGHENGTPVNDSPVLEQEAHTASSGFSPAQGPSHTAGGGTAPVQMFRWPWQKKKSGGGQGGGSSPAAKAERNARQQTFEERRASGSLASFFKLPAGERRKINRSMQPVTPDMGVNRKWIEQTVHSGRANAQRHAGSEGFDLDDDWLNDD